MVNNTACGSTDQVIDNICSPPEVCGDNAEDNKTSHLLRHSKHNNENFVRRTISRDKPLLVAILIMAVILHTPYFKLTLYPFLIFSTWVHEMCHVRFLPVFSFNSDVSFGVSNYSLAQWKLVKLPSYIFRVLQPFS